MTTVTTVTRVTASSRLETYTFPGRETVDGEGKVTNRAGPQELGFLGATVGFFSDRKGFLKIVSLGASVGQVLSDSDQLAAASTGFNTAGTLCAIPDAISDGATAVSSFMGKKPDYIKGSEKGFKSLAGFASIPSSLHKMGAVTISSTALYAVGALKNIADVIADLFSLIMEFKKKPTAGNIQKHLVDGALVGAEKTEIWAARVKVIVALVFHIFLAIGAIFLIPFSPIAVTVFAVVYTVTVIAHHYIKCHKDDLDVRNRMQFIALAVTN